MQPSDTVYYANKQLEYISWSLESIYLTPKNIYNNPPVLGQIVPLNHTIMIATKFQSLRWNNCNYSHWSMIQEILLYLNHSN